MLRMRIPPGPTGGRGAVNFFNVLIIINVFKVNIIFFKRERFVIYKAH
jgi:uncharacterized membrane protein (DUF373 family)